MTPLMWSGVIIVVLVFCILLMMSELSFAKKNLKDSQFAYKECKESRDAHRDDARRLELGRDSRETYLKRALEDLAFAEIDRARFALEVVYGKTKL